MAANVPLVPFATGELDPKGACFLICSVIYNMERSLTLIAETSYFDSFCSITMFEALSLRNLRDIHFSTNGQSCGISHSLRSSETSFPSASMSIDDYSNCTFLSEPFEGDLIIDTARVDRFVLGGEAILPLKAGFL